MRSHHIMRFSSFALIYCSFFFALGFVALDIYARYAQ
jgi:hypothetical protein